MSITSLKKTLSKIFQKSNKRSKQTNKVLFFKLPSKKFLEPDKNSGITIHSSISSWKDTFPENLETELTRKYIEIENLTKNVTDQKKTIDVLNVSVTSKNKSLYEYKRKLENKELELTDLKRKFELVKVFFSYTKKQGEYVKQHDENLILSDDNEAIPGLEDKIQNLLEEKEELEKQIFKVKQELSQVIDIVIIKDDPEMIDKLEHILDQKL